MDLHSVLVKHATYPLLHRREGMRGLYRYLHELECSQWLSRDEIEHLQFERLRAILRHAYDNTSYYKRVMDDLGAKPEDFRHPADVAKLPVLSKEIIRANRDDLIVRNLAPDDIHFSDTGGTTGIKMTFCRDNACLSPKAAATIRHERWTGWDVGRLRGLVWPAQQDYVGYDTWKAKLRNALRDRQCVLPAAVLDEERIGVYLETLRRHRPVMILGFATPLYLVAKHALENGDDRCRVPAIISTGEPLLPYQRRAMEQAFDAEVFDSYGAREVALIAQECPEHKGMHINAESVYVETIESEVAGLRKVVVTDLLNHGMPLIRYDMGDTGSLSDAVCPCGRGLPLMDMGVGREGDYLISPAGEYVAVGSLVLYLVDNGPSVGQVQLIQDEPAHLTVRMTRDPVPDETVYAHYRKEIARLFGNEMRVSFDLVDAIGCEPSGKYRFSIRRLRSHGSSVPS